VEKPQKPSPISIPDAESRDLFVFEGTIQVLCTSVKVVGGSVKGADVCIGKDGQVYGKSVMSVVSEGEETFMAITPEATELFFKILGIGNAKTKKKQR